jgi:glyoxylase-like metal-dependent hydrolase (beta-lactamase superfamily II)
MLNIEFIETSFKKIQRPVRGSALSIEIHRLVLPDYITRGEVNAFLIKEDPITLIDTGPNTKDALDALVRRLRGIDLTIEDIKRIVITHSHQDHCGLARQIKEISGAVLLASRDIKPWLEDYRAEWNNETLKIMRLLETYEVPRSYISVLVTTMRGARKLGAVSKVDHILEPGGTIEFADFELETLNSPGHSHWCISLFEPKERILFCGDLLMENLTAHPLIQPTRQAPEDWPNQVEMIHKSLDVVCSLDPDVAYPGHGSPIDSAVTIKEKIVESHFFKQDKILEILKGGEKKLFQINQGLNKFVPPVELLVAIFETIHHLNCLLGKGLVRRKESLFSLS